MRFRRTALLCVVSALAVLAPVGAIAASAVTTPAGHSASKPAKPYPVHWDFLVGAIAANLNAGPSESPAGSNLPCKPSQAHPRPIVLVHGLAANQSDNWAALAPYLANHGYCVFSFTYGNISTGPSFLARIGGLSDMTASAKVLAKFVQHVRRVTRAKKVDLVGHSEGGTMPDWYLKFDHGSRYVDHFVVLSGVLHGTTMFGTSSLFALAQQYGYSGGSSASLGGLCASCTEFVPTSTWMKTLDAAHPVATVKEAATCPTDGAAVDGIKYTSIGTNNDELVRPPTSDFIKPGCATRRTRIGVHNILIQNQCPQDQSDHLSVAADPNVARDVLNALDPAHAERVHCQLVLPSVG